MRKILLVFVSLLLFVGSFLSSDFLSLKPKIKTAQAADFNSSNLISDGDFINIDSMNTNEIQAFLNGKGGFLKDFSEGGRSAAQIIYDASHGYGDAAGSISGISINTSTGSVSPKVILVTLQKEQSLITKTSRDDSVLNKAMGYACPDSGGCNSAYAGFTKQVENAAWQLRYNYERAQGRGFSDYQVGQSFNFDGDTGTFSNRATASLYRYTPHVYNGNYNFWNLFANTYKFTSPLYSYRVVSQGPGSGDGSARDPIAPGRSTQWTVALQNTGSEAWSKNGANPVDIGMSGPRDRGSVFTGGNNLRMYMDEDTVVSGGTGTFRLNIVAPNAPGEYREHFDLVIEGIKWVGGDFSYYLRVGNPLSAQYINGGQEPYTSDSKVHLAPGESTTLTVRFKNTSGANWYNSSANPIHIGNSNPHDRLSAFQNNQNIRGTMREDGVAHGQTGTFDISITAPSQKGTRPATDCRLAICGRRSLALLECFSFACSAPICSMRHAHRQSPYLQATCSSHSGIQFKIR